MQSVYIVLLLLSILLVSIEAVNVKDQKLNKRFSNRLRVRRPPPSGGALPGLPGLPALPQLPSLPPLTGVLPTAPALPGLSKEEEA